MTNSHIPKSTEAKLAPPAVSLCSFSSWFASHVHILHRLDSMFTSAPARATTPTRNGVYPVALLCFCTSFCERNWSSGQRCSDAWRCNHEGKRTEPRPLRSRPQWIWHPSTSSRRSSLSGFLPPAVMVSVWTQWPLLMVLLSYTKINLLCPINDHRRNTSLPPLASTDSQRWRQGGVK